MEKTEPAPSPFRPFSLFCPFAVGRLIRVIYVFRGQKWVVVSVEQVKHWSWFWGNRLDLSKVHAPRVNTTFPPGVSANTRNRMKINASLVLDCPQVLFPLV